MANKKHYPQDQYEKPVFNLPYQKIYLYLLLLGLTFLFVAFAIGYVYTRSANEVGQGVYLPPIFIANSVLLLLSSLTVKAANTAYKEDETKKYQNALNLTFLLTAIFLVMQVLAWTLYKDALMGENIGNGKQYLYALSGLHFAHVFGALPFLLYFMYVASVRMKEPVSVLVYFSDPAKKLHLELLTVYWHFLDALWIFLVLFFLLNMLF